MNPPLTRRWLAASAALLLLLLVAATAAPRAARWVGTTFPGFLPLENRVVASVGLAQWPATAGGEIFQSEILAIDGAPAGSTAELMDAIQLLPPGTPVRYRMQRGTDQFERTIPTRLFTKTDFVLLFGVYLLNGLAMGGTAVALFARRTAAATAAAPLLLIGALWGLSAMDLYGVSHLFRLHALCEVLLFPAALHMAMAFPAPFALSRGRAWLTAAPYAFAAGLALVYQLGLDTPTSYVLSHLLATTLLGVALLFLLATQLLRFFRPPSLVARRQLGVLAVGALVAVVLPACLTGAELYTGGRMPQNAVGFTAFLLPLSVGWAAAREPLARWASPPPARNG